MERKAGTAVKPGETELARQLEYIRAIRAENDAFAAENGRKKKFYSLAMGCQMNAHDSEKLEGMLDEMGFDRTDEETEADFIIYNTCCVRENAEQKVYGKLGWLKHYKETKNPDAVIALCGCMMQQETVLQTLRQKYRHVDIVFGTFNLYKLPELVATRMESGETVYDIWQEQREVVEDLPAIRHFPYKASVNIMFGCNNFCSYCIVPYVRGRERSRRPEEIEKELRELVAAGYKEITLLGQNVNSYGKDLGIDVDFADLLRRLNAVPGDFWLRFMTSHPKDASPKLFSAMAECDKVAKQLHLPFQSGSDEILHRMNRRYTAERYKSLIADARSKMPDITLSSDIIVGFPGETDEDFEQTLKLVQDTRFDLLFTFLYSPRTGTPAASYEDNATPQDKQRRFERLLKAQDEIVAEKQAAYQGRKLRLLVDGNAKGPEYPFTARTEGNLLVCVRGDDIKIGEFIEAEIEKTSLRCLFAHKL